MKKLNEKLNNYIIRVVQKDDDDDIDIWTDDTVLTD